MVGWYNLACSNLSFVVSCPCQSYINVKCFYSVLLRSSSFLFPSDRERALVDYNANINIVLLKHEYCIKHKQPKGQWQEHFIFRVNHYTTGARDSRSRRQFEEVPDNLSHECHEDRVTGQRDGRHELDEDRLEDDKLDEDRLEDPVMNVASQQSRWGRVWILVNSGYCYYCITRDSSHSIVRLLFFTRFAWCSIILHRKILTGSHSQVYSHLWSSITLAIIVKVTHFVFTYFLAVAS